jgi:hypothetical protein
LLNKNVEPLLPVQDAWIGIEDKSIALDIVYDASPRKLIIFFIRTNGAVFAKLVPTIRMGEGAGQAIPVTL